MKKCAKVLHYNIQNSCNKLTYFSTTISIWLQVNIPNKIEKLIFNNMSTGYCYVLQLK